MVAAFIQMRGALYEALPGIILALLLIGCVGVRPTDRDNAYGSEKGAVIAMLDTAREESAAGRPDRAAAVLERALRIEPRNAVIWRRLARLRLDQGAFSQAASMAAKSNTLAGDNNRLRAANWRLIGEAREGGGDAAGAREAFDLAARLDRQ